MRTIRLELSGEARTTAAALCSWDISVWRGRVPFLEGEGCGMGPTRDRGWSTLTRWAESGGASLASHSRNRNRKLPNDTNVA